MEAAPARRGLAVAAVAVAVAAGCDEIAVSVGPGPLARLERSAVEEVAVDRIRDLFWVADGTAGGSFPRLAYAFALPGVDAGTLASATVDPSFSPGRFSPFCSASVVAGIAECARITLLADADWEVEVYYTVPPDSTPRERPELTYAGDGAVASVRWSPQPLRVWRFAATSDGQVTGASSRLVEEFTLVPETGSQVRLTVTGVEAVELATQRVDVELLVQGLTACPELRVSFSGTGGGGAGGEVLCGRRVWADILHRSGQPPEVDWRDGV